jgi:hypothetical protein
MLRLTGRLADGWLPSLSYLQPGQLTEGNALIDRAAIEAGREPGAIRRLLNIGGEVSAAGQWAERLADLALTEGIGTFVLASDDPDTIRGFAAEVAPAVREQVAAARSGAGGPSSSGRSGASRPSSSGPSGASRPSSSGRSGAGRSGLTRPAGSSRITDSGGPGVQVTPDDGTRLSEQRLWDETVRPARPAPPPGARYTAAGRAASAELVAVHDMLRAELDTVDRALVNYISQSGDTSALTDAADLLTDTLLSHLAYEERELIDPLARYGFYGYDQD